MAIAIHVARVQFVSVKPNGTVINKTAASTTINDVMISEHKHVVMVDALIPSSANNPTVDTYLKLEAAAGFKLQYMDNDMIVTYPA